MIGLLSQKAANRMYKKHYIEKEDIPAYQFGIFRFLNITKFFLLSVAAGAVFKVLSAAILFFTGFALLRNFGGGYHPNTGLKSRLLSSVIIVSDIFLIKFSYISQFRIFLFAAAGVAAVIIFFLAPVDFSEQPLSPEERRIYKRTCRSVILSLFVAAVLFFILRGYTLFTGIMLALITESMLLVAGKIHNTQFNKTT